MTIPVWLKPGLLGVAIGALAWWAILASGLGWVSAGTAKQMANSETQSAVVASIAAYCVSRFEQQTNAVASWRALKKAADNYNQDAFIQKGGWILLPGQKLNADTASAVADACATKLLALNQIDGVKLSSLNVK
jgi:hypothetical protein